MKKLKAFGKRLWQEESAQGATEYILLLVVVVAVVLIFRQRIVDAVNDKLDQLAEGMNSISTQ